MKGMPRMQSVSSNSSRNVSFVAPSHRANQQVVGSQTSRFLQHTGGRKIAFLLITTAGETCQLAIAAPPSDGKAGLHSPMAPPVMQAGRKEGRHRYAIPAPTTKTKAMRLIDHIDDLHLQSVSSSMGIQAAEIKLKRMS